MRLEISPLITDISGKVKDVVFSSWKSHKYVRSRALRRKPASSAQTIVRNYYSKASFCWQQFTDDYKNAWRDYARGRGFSGFNYWMKAQETPYKNYNFHTASPYNPNVKKLDGLVAQQGVLPDSIDIEWTGGPTDPEYKLSVYLRWDHGNTLYLISHDDIPASDMMATVFSYRSGYNCYLYVSVQNVLTRELSLSDWVHTKTG